MRDDSTAPRHQLTCACDFVTIGGKVYPLQKGFALRAVMQRRVAKSTTERILAAAGWVSTASRAKQDRKRESYYLSISKTFY